MKVWISKWAITVGVFEAEVEVNQSFPSMAFYKPEGHHFKTCLHKRASGKSDWYLTREEAVADAERRRKLKLASLQKQIKKITEMKFD